MATKKKAPERASERAPERAPERASKAQSSEVIVEPVQTVSLAPRVTDSKFTALLPKYGEHPIRSSVIIHGINNAIANGIRRVLLTESSSMALYIDQDSFITDDPFVMIDMITQRVLLIPLVQSMVHKDMRFTLDVANDSDEPMDVHSAHLIPITKGSGKSTARDVLPFYETINIVTLQPYKKIQFAADIIVGNGMDNAIFATAFTAMSIPLDERPIDICDEDIRVGTASLQPSGKEPIQSKKAPVESLDSSISHEVEPKVQRSPIGLVGAQPLPYNDRARYLQSSSISDPHVYQIVFETVGKGDPELILTRAIDILISRLKIIKDAKVILGQERQSGGSSARTMITGEDMTNLYTIKIPGETQTIGNLFMKCCLEVFPRIDFVTFDLDDLTNELIIRVRTLEDPIEIVIEKSIKYALDKLEAIRHALE